MSMRVCDSHALWCGVVYNGYFLHADLIGADELEDLVSPFGEFQKLGAALANAAYTNSWQVALPRKQEIEP